MLAEEVAQTSHKDHLNSEWPKCAKRLVTEQSREGLPCPSPAKAQASTDSFPCTLYNCAKALWTEAVRDKNGPREREQLWAGGIRLIACDWVP